MKSRVLQNLLSPFAAIAACGFMLGACNREDKSPTDGFSLSIGNTITVEAISEEDTIKTVVRSSLEWSVESPEWVEVSPETSDGSPMLVRIVILNNGGIDVRQGEIIFKLSNGATYSVLCTQFPSGGGLVIRDHIVNNLNGDEQSFGAEIFMNLKNPSSEIIPADASSWLTAVLASGEQPYEYMLNVNVAANNSGKLRSAKVVISGDANGTPMTDTIYVSQMYQVENLAGSITNDASAFEVDWTPSSNAAIAYYTLEVTDGKATPAVLANYDVTDQSAALVDTMLFMRNGGYFGPLSITVSGKASASEETIIGQTATMRANSHFGGSGDGTLASPYEIGCLRHFNNIMAAFNAFGATKISGDMSAMQLNFKQTADITFPDPTSGTALGANLSVVGSKTAPFLGSYDGGNFKFSNVYIISDAAYVGIFGQLGEGGATSTATVKNMNVYVNYIEGRATTWGSNTNAAAIGGIVGMNAGNITDCAVYKYGADAVVYGNNRNTAGAAINNATYMGYTGGIAGANERNIFRCKNIDCPVVSRYVAGGIAGGITVPPAVVSNVASYTQYCYNLADVYQGNPGPSVTLPMGITIDAELVAYSAEYAASGIVGNAIGQGTNYRHNIDNCFNGGHIYSENMASGIVGRIHFANTTKCFNYGTVTVVRNEGTAATVTKSAGGIAGFLNNNQNTTSTCYNVGKLEYVDALGTGVGITMGGCVGGKGTPNPVMNNLVCLNQSDLTGGAATNNGVWGSGTNLAVDVATCFVLPDANLQSLANYPSGFTSADWVIKPGYAYPQLVANPMP